MKIVKLQASNFKRLVAVEITPDGNLVTISGKNGAGKSAVLDAVQAALGGSRTLPDKPIREGEGRAQVVVETEEYTVTRKFTLGKSTLEIKNKARSAVASPQALLDKIVGSIAFDPLAFSQMGDKDQRAKLLEVMDLDLAAHDTAIETVRNERKELLAAKKRADGDMETMEFTPDMPEGEVSVSDLAQTLQEANVTNKKGEELERRYAAAESLIAEHSEHIAKLKGIVQELRGEMKQVQQECIEVELIDTQAIQAQIENAEEINQKVRANIAYRAAEDFSGVLADEIKKKYDAINDAEAAKSNAISEAKMPVKGLGIDANGLTLAGIPFRQVNHAKRLEVSMAVAMAMNPELRVMMVNGNGLDKESMETIAKLAEAHDYQVWLEVQTEGEDGVGIVIEDGEVKA